MKIRHYFADFNGLGGVNQMMRNHHELDANYALESDFIIYTERAVPTDRIQYLGIHGWRTIASGRRAVAKIVDSAPAEVAVFHGLWGLENLGDIENAGHKVLVLHGETPGLEPFLREYGTYLSGIGCVSRPLVQMVSRSCPQLTAAQIVLIPYPIEPPDDFKLPAAERPCFRDPVKIGVCGRVARGQKRVDRLPLFCREMRNAGIPFELEILGDGVDLSWLKEQLADFPEVAFLGRQSGVGYWQALAGWDIILFVSDFEGLPIAMLEAMACGVIPVFPKIGCGGDDYVERIDPNLLYDSNNLSSATKSVQWLTGHKGDSIARLRTACRNLVKPHKMDGYFQAVKTLLTKASSFSSSSTLRQEFPGRSTILDHMPMRILEKTAKWRNKSQPMTDSALGKRDGLTGMFFRKTN